MPVAETALAALSLLGLVMAGRMLLLSQQAWAGRGGLGAAMATMGLVAMLTAVQGGAIAMQSVARGLGAG